MPEASTEKSVSKRTELYVSKPQGMDPEKIVSVLGPWKIYSWENGYRFESPKVPNLPQLVMIIAKEGFRLQPAQATPEDPKVYLKDVTKVKVLPHGIVIETKKDGSCFVWQQGLKVQLFFGRKRAGSLQSEAIMSFGNPPER